jgi:hypothetical protein
MRKTAIGLFVLSFLHFGMYSQDLDKMNKKEVKDYALGLLTETYSLKAEITRQENLKDELSKRISQLERQQTESSNEISRLLTERTNRLKEIEQLKSEKETSVNLLNSIITDLQDSIKDLKLSALNTMAYEASDPDDILNNLFFDASPMDGSFRLSLRKILFGKVAIEDYYSRNKVSSLPEIIDGNNFTYWAVKPNKKVISDTEFNDYVQPQSEAYFNSLLPTIEIINNKFVTITYADGSEEAFLFKASKQDNNNNNRSVIDFDLEGVDNENESRDLTWRLFVIESEVYLALSVNQLNRLKVDIRHSSKGLEVYDLDGDIYNTTSMNSYYKYTTTGNGIYLSRKKDSFMDGSYYSNTENLVFLFKFK